MNPNNIVPIEAKRAQKKSGKPPASEIEIMFAVSVLSEDDMAALEDWLWRRGYLAKRSTSTPSGA
ncbi:MAG: hypothetical protein AAFV53_26150 [Myxococcota bacterium]